MPTLQSQSKLHGITTRRWWPWLKGVVKIGFFLAVAYLLFTQARTIQWSEVLATLRDRSMQGLWPAAALAAASYALYSCFDLLGRYVTAHALPPRKVLAVTFISYAFNLNLGALVGGAAFRYRLYSRLGLKPETITRILATSMFTNWLGYLVLAGFTFWLHPLAPPPHWKIDIPGLHILGITLLAVALSYMLLCAFSSGRTWSVKGHKFTVPSLQFALLQLAMSCTNWLLIASAVFVLLEQKIDFPDVLCVMLIAAIAGVITHVPAGLGVIEAVFVALLSHRLPTTTLLASLLLYRTIYYFVPLAVATLAYLVVEARVGAGVSGAPEN